MTIYDEVEEKALPLIKAYQNDLLVHDRKTMTENPETPFLHFTGDTGTYLVLMIPGSDYPNAGETVPYFFGKADRDRILRGKVTLVVHAKQTNRQDLILYFDGEKLSEVTQEKAELVIWKYQKRILREW